MQITRCSVRATVIFNLLSISKVKQLGNTTDINEKGCLIYNAKGKLIAERLKVGSLSII